jgi:hypothetical protein
MLERKKIVAVDFDGILCLNKFPRIGESNPEMVEFVKRMQNAGVETILWTSRVGDRLKDAVRWCEEHGLNFKYVNAGVVSNVNEYGTDPRKVFADIYIDDQEPYFQWCAKFAGYVTAIEVVIEMTEEWLKSEGVKL